MANYYDYFKSFEIELQYIISGWLDNRGKFYECYWGQHTSLAYEIVRENNWMEEYHNAEKNCCMENARDWLIRVKKYILLDNPCYDHKTQVLQYNPICKHSKSQINKLLTLFEYSDIMTEYIVQNI